MINLYESLCRGDLLSVGLDPVERSYFFIHLSKTTSKIFEKIARKSQNCVIANSSLYMVTWRRCASHRTWHTPGRHDGSSRVRATAADSGGGWSSVRYTDPLEWSDSCTGFYLSPASRSVSPQGSATVKSEQIEIHARTKLLLILLFQFLSLPKNLLSQLL